MPQISLRRQSLECYAEKFLQETEGLSTLHRPRNTRQCLGAENWRRQWISTCGFLHCDRVVKELFFTFPSTRDVYVFFLRHFVSSLLYTFHLLQHSHSKTAYSRAPPCRAACKGRRLYHKRTPELNTAPRIALKPKTTSAAALRDPVRRASVRLVPQNCITHSKDVPRAVVDKDQARKELTQPPRTSGPQ